MSLGTLPARRRRRVEIWSSWHSFQVHGKERSLADNGSVVMLGWEGRVYYTGVEPLCH